MPSPKSARGPLPPPALRCRTRRRRCSCRPRAWVWQHRRRTGHFAVRAYRFGTHLEPVLRRWIVRDPVVFPRRDSGQLEAISAWMKKRKIGQHLAREAKRKRIGVLRLVGADWPDFPIDQRAPDLAPILFGPIPEGWVDANRDWFPLPATMLRHSDEKEPRIPVWIGWHRALSDGGRRRGQLYSGNGGSGGIGITIGRPASSTTLRTSTSSRRYLWPKYTDCSGVAP